MSETVIHVENLSKRYRLGELHKQTHSFREKVTNSFNRIARNVKGRLNPFNPSTPSTSEAPDYIYALRNVSLQVKRGEVLGIIGRNGAGKSTLLKILSRITRPTDGTAWINGRVGSLLEVGTGFHQELTGRENIFLNGAILGMTKAEIKRKFDEIVDFAEIEKFIDTPVKRYSSGMYVRLAFAVAAHLEPEILLVDEVLAVGDAGFQKKCLGKMGEASLEGRTVLFVSHNMAAIESLCSKAILLDGGNLITYGPTLDTIASYLSRIDGERLSQGRRIGEFSRQANTPGIIRRVVLLSSKQEATDQIRVGDACEFHVELESTEVLLDLAVGLHVQTESRQRVTSFHTRYQQCPTMDLNGRLTLRCRCPELMLVPGNYILELAVASSGRIKDRIDHSLSFCVIDANVLGSGKVPPLKDGVLISRGYWEVPQA